MSTTATVWIIEREDRGVTSLATQAVYADESAAVRGLSELLRYTPDLHDETSDGETTRTLSCEAGGYLFFLVELAVKS